MMPWPGAGTHVGIGSAAEIRARWPSRTRPADARTSASYPPSSSFRRRVSRFPRIGRNWAAGKSRVSCAIRLTLLVPIRGQLPSRATSSSNVTLVSDASLAEASADSLEAEAGTLALSAGNTTASRASSRGSAAPIARPLGSTTGMSLLLWTARSISPASSASSISFTKRRLPPICAIVASASRSPEVLITTISHSIPGLARKSAETVLA